MSEGFFVQLAEAQISRRSRLCVGLDPDPQRWPLTLQAKADRAEALFAFCAQIVQATAEFACCFKPQFAYFAALGAEAVLARVIAFIHQNAPGVPVILDAKRGDIGETAKRYAAEAFERYSADALTLSPYMGFDSVEPYFAYPDKGLYLLCRTSNPGAADLQNLSLAQGGALFEEVARLAARWNAGASGQIGLVAGATEPAAIVRIRALAPALPLLVPGVGAQGGEVVPMLAALGGAALPHCVNASRAVLYAAPPEASEAEFFAASAAAARQWRDTLNAA